jgi:hypothetical protein
VPQWIVQLKEDEFWELTQDGRSVSEYVHKFTKLARYTPDDVSTEVKRMARFLKGLIPELKTILASQDFLSFLHLSNKAYKWKGQGKKKKVTSRGNSKSSELSSKTGTREFDPLGFHPRDQASLDQLDPLRHVSASRVRAPFMPPRLQATNRLQMPVGTAETPVTSRTTRWKPQEYHSFSLQLGEWPQEYLSTRPQGALLHQPVEQDPVSRKGTSKPHRCSRGSASSGSSAR